MQPWIMHEIMANIFRRAILPPKAASWEEHPPKPIGMRQEPSAPV